MKSRRSFLKNTALGALGLGIGHRLDAQLPKDAATEGFKIVSGRIRQSIMGWCFKPMPTLELAKHCKDIGLVAMEGIPQSAYKGVMDLGLKISLVGSHGFAQGPCDPKFREKAVKKLEEAIDVASDIGCSKVITFTGMRYDGMDDEEAAKRCMDAWKAVLPKAEKKGITLCLEHLNSRDDTHPMKGHPGYFGDDVDFCLDMIKEVGSPHLRLLFDIYHVSVMNGDVIRRIRTESEFIAHYHTAGNPGRGELDDTQEINYPAVMREILKTGYSGYVAQEFIPNWEDPIGALRHAAEVCDV